MRRTRSISPELKEQIHFATLQTQAKEIIAEQAQHTWTDTAEHDPGITLLDAMAYNVSDLAYRHVLPIEDLLTPSNEKLSNEALGHFHEQLLAGESTKSSFGVVCALSSDGNVFAAVMGGDAHINEIHIFESIDNKFVLRQKLSNPTKQDDYYGYCGYYGYSMAISSNGDRIAIGAPYSGYLENGRVYIYERSGSPPVWGPSIPLSLNFASSGYAQAGQALSMSADGKTVASGSKLTVDTPIVYIHKQYGDADWQKLVQKITRPKEDTRFGYALCLSPDAAWLAIASRKSINDQADVGAVYVYQFNHDASPPQFELVQEICSPSVKKESFFGNSLHFDQSGTRLAIGAPGTSAGGAVYTYRYDAQKKWQDESQLHALDVTADGGFGYAVRFGKQDTLAIGTCKKPVNKGGSVQAVCAYLFRFEQQKWLEVKSFKGLAAPSPVVVNEYRYGQALAISADDQCLVVGMPQTTADGKTDIGNQYVVRASIKKEHLFPESFGPHQALTCSPITVEDYRRALLDLRHGRTNQFYFRNIQLKPIQAEDSQSYQYGYDPKKRQFTFQSEGTGIEKKVLLGDYILYVELGRDVKKEMAGLVLDQFLIAHRNLGESVRVVQYLSPVKAAITATIEVEDGVDDVAPILAQIYTLTENYLRPPALRARAADLVAQGWDKASIYQGPKLTHGWITQLPPERDYSQPCVFQLTPLVKLWKEIPGVRTIVAFDSGQKGKPWELIANAYQYAMAFSETPFADLAKGQRITLHKRGRLMSTTEAAIRQALPVAEVIDEVPVTLPVGRHRHPRRYHPVSLRLPACYQLQKPELKPEIDLPQIHLHQFLLAFEQQLANGCDQLAQLPSLLSFARQEKKEEQQKDPVIWGAQWPFNTPGIPNEVPNTLHQPYRAALETFNQNAAGNPNKELDIIDYLLSYFGEHRALRTLLSAKGPEAQMHDFLAVQRGYLQQITELTYHRAAIRIDQVCALQRRIAARLGWAPELFDEGNLDLTNLPFYIVERRALLPKKPTNAYNDPQDIVTLAYEKGTDGSTNIGIRMTVKNTVKMDTLTAGQLIDFTELHSSKDINVLLALNVISEVDTANHTVLFVFANNSNLEKKAHLLWKERDPTSAIAVQWKSSQEWLYKMVYTLAYADSTNSSGTRRKLLVRPFPSYIKEGATLTLYKVSVKHAKPQEEELSATIKEVDLLLGQVVVEMSLDSWNLILPGEEQLWNWSFANPEGQGMQDYFSFMVSVVMNRALLKEVIDLQATAAWIEEVILEEMPAHIVPCIQWLDEENADNKGFKAFAATYVAWQNGGQPLGDLSYKLLEFLGIGSLNRVTVLGVESMRVATAAQQAKATKGDGSLNMDYIQDYSLSYVPEEEKVSSTGHK